MTHPELNSKMAQAHTADLRRRAATLRRTGSTSGTATNLLDAVPLTIRFAGAHDEAPLAALAALDSSPALMLPALIAEVEGQPRSALSLADGRVIADPFHPTAELVALLHARAEQLTERPRGDLASALRAALRMLRAVRLELRWLGPGGR